MQRHVDAQRLRQSGSGPVFGDEAALGFKRGRHGFRPRGNGGLRRIADDPGDHAAVGGDGLAQEGIVAGVSPFRRLPVLLPQPSRAGDVSEEKGYRPVGQVRHAHPPARGSVAHQVP